MAVRQHVERPLRRFGYTIVGTGGLRFQRLHRIGSLPPGLEHLRTDRTGRFTVELDRVTTPLGFSYHPYGWHPYRATLDEFLAEPDLLYERSTLCTYFRRYQPTTVQAALIEDANEPMEPLCHWPPLLYLFKHIWGMSRRRVDQILSRPSVQKTSGQQFGPKTDEQGRQHLARILGAHESLRRHGYQPSQYPDGALAGYFLVRDDQYRFVVFQGNHRLPSMRLLGVDRLDARFHPGHPPVINAADLAQWTTPRGGLFAPAVAQRLFDKLFEERGDTKARNLGLLTSRSV
jgi:hypothetical protein